jgi:hypothetical protein
MLASPAPVWSVLYMAWRTLSVTLYTANLRGLGIRSITERLSLFYSLLYPLPLQRALRQRLPRRAGHRAYLVPFE